MRPNILKVNEVDKKLYYIKLGTQPSATVTIKIPDIEADYDLIHDKDELTFTKDNWNQEQTVEVTAKRDTDWNLSVVSYPLTAKGSGYDDVNTNIIVKIRDIDKPLTASIRGLPKKINTNDALPAEFNFARAVTGFKKNDITVTGGTKGATLLGSGTRYTLLITPNGDEDVVVTISKNAATDGVVKGPSKQVTKIVVWDATAPTVTISGIPSKINSTNNLTATFTFSVPVTGFETGDIRVDGGTKSAFKEVISSTVYTLVITPKGNAHVVVTVDKNAVSDGINRGPKVPVKVMAIWDAMAPTLDITGLPGKINTTADLKATFTFSESVTGFESNDITVDGGTKKDFDGSGGSYTLVITPSRGQDIKVTVPANAATDGLNEGPPVMYTRSLLGMSDLM